MQMHERSHRLADREDVRGGRDAVALTVTIDWELFLSISSQRPRSQVEGCTVIDLPEPCIRSSRGQCNHLDCLDLLLQLRLQFRSRQGQLARWIATGRDLARTEILGSSTSASTYLQAWL